MGVSVRRVRTRLGRAAGGRGPGSPSLVSSAPRHLLTALFPCPAGLATAFSGALRRPGLSHGPNWEHDRASLQDSGLGPGGRLREPGWAREGRCQAQPPRSKALRLRSGLARPRRLAQEPAALLAPVQLGATSGDLQASKAPPPCPWGLSQLFLEGVWPGLGLGHT